MKKFFYSHPQVVLSVIAIILLSVIFWFLSWGVNDVVVEVHRAMVVASMGNSSKFDVEDASALDFHGITINTSTISAVANATGTGVAAPGVVATSTPFGNPTSTR